MRILIFHGYLLGGTGSNVYNARLARELVKLGHEVCLVSQERRPERYPFIDAAGDWDSGELVVRPLQDRPVRCTAYRPPIGPVLPVYVEDRYEGVEARAFVRCTDAQVDRYIEANVVALEELACAFRPDIALANHLVMGPVVLARSLGGAVRYAVKVHGSALEYTVKRSPDRFLGYAREGVEGATGILVGSVHTARSLWEGLGCQWSTEHGIRERTVLGPPGVDVELFKPASRDKAFERLRALADRLFESSAEAAAAGTDGAGEVDDFARDELQAASALNMLCPPASPPEMRLVGYVGKLIVNKGVDLLLTAWPLVADAVPGSRLVVVGFGGVRSHLEAMADSLAACELEPVRRFAVSARSLEQAGAPGSGAADAGQEPPLGLLLAFLDSLEGERLSHYLSCCRSFAGSVLFTGRLDHEELADLLPACEAVVVPSTFPEAFGMVAAEAAACGALPIVAGHSGLAEVSAALATVVPEEIAPLLSFAVDDGAVWAIAERLIDWLQAGERVRQKARTAVSQEVGGRWSWETVALTVIATATGSFGSRPLTDSQRLP